MGYRFVDRQHAGRSLAGLLGEYADAPGVVVVGLPRGGVPVAHEIATALRAPMDVFIVRKIGAPGQPELAVGAVTASGLRVLDPGIIRALGLDDESVQRVAERELAEARRREKRYCRRPGVDVEGRTVIVVDDGMATGLTMLAAIAALRELGPAEIVVAVPVAALDACRSVEREGARCVCATASEQLDAIGAWYERFEQLSDAEVEAIIDER